MDRDNKLMDMLIKKLDTLDSRLDNIDVTLAKQHVQLAEHIRRTNLIEDSMKPIEIHVAKVTSGLALAVKLLSVASTILGIAAVIWSFVR